MRIRRFNETQQNGYKVGDVVIIKQNLDNIIGVSGMYLTKGPIHPLYKIQGDNGTMNEFLGKEAKITYVVSPDDKSNDKNEFRFYRYLIDLDNGDHWWVDECFEKN